MMDKQNVNIVNFNSLYEILNEIKENLPFQVNRYDSENDFIEDQKNTIKNTLIVTKLKSKNLDRKNLLIFKDLPIPLIKLVEIININLIKLKFNHQSNINIKGYELNLNSKFLSKDNLNLKLTEKEIEIILYLNSKKTKQKVLDLQESIWRYSSDLETHTVETHIYRLRKKIKDKFDDQKFIISYDKGYII
jgi:hypothetical protein